LETRIRCQEREKRSTPHPKKNPLDKKKERKEEAK
jgi:hypothetical protein